MQVPPVALLLALLLCLAAPLHGQEEHIQSRIKRRPVQSSNVASVGYSRKLHALEIEFTRGAVYRFLAVSPRVYRDLLLSDSKGHFIAEHIRGQYYFVCVRPSRLPSRSRLTAEPPIFTP